MDGFLGPANFALDFAAPVESASAPFDHFLHLRFVASSAAHQIATVDSDRRLVAHASLRSGDAQFEILLAEVGRVLVVDQIFLGRRLVLGIVGLQLVVVLLATVARRPSSVANEHPRCSVKTILQIVADDAEKRQPHPAGAHRTRTAHPVTFTFLSHLG